MGQTDSKKPKNEKKKKEVPVADLDAQSENDENTDRNDTDGTAEKEQQEARPSVHSDAPSADNLGRDTVSSDTAPNVEETKEEEPKKDAPKEEKKAPVAGGMKTITDKQALLTRKMYGVIKDLPEKDLMDLYAAARRVYGSSRANHRNAPQVHGPQGDRSLATMLACRQRMLHAEDKTLRTFAEDNVGAEQMNFGILIEDSNKLSSDIDEKTTDWSAVEESVKNDAQEKKHESTISPEAAKYAKAEIEALKDKSTEDLIADYKAFWNDANNKRIEAKYNPNPKTQEDYDKALGKTLAADYSMRQKPDLKAQIGSLQNNSVYHVNFDFLISDVDDLFEEIEKEKNAPIDPSRDSIAEEAPTVLQEENGKEEEKKQDEEKEREEKEERKEEKGPEEEKEQENKEIDTPSEKDENEYPEEPEDNAKAQEKTEAKEPEVKPEEPKIETELPEINGEKKETEKGEPTLTEGKAEGVENAKPEPEKKNVVEETTRVVEDNKKENPENAAKKTEEKKEVKKTPEELKSRMEYVGGVFSATVGKKVDNEQLGEFEKTLESLGKLSPELQKPMFEQMFREHAKSELQSAISATAATRKAGKAGASFPEVSGKTQEYLKAQFDYFASKNPALKDMQYPSFGGLQPSEIRDMQNNALLSLPVKAHQENEKKAIGEEFTANRQKQEKEISGSFSAQVSQLNKEQGVSFSAAGIEKYLASRWKEGAGKDLDSQREHFQKELMEFREKAYEKMLSKIDGKTDLSKQLAAFDKFSSHLDTMCKAKGWIDKDTPYAFAGDLAPSKLKDMQTKAVDRIPKNTAEKAADIIDDLTGEKEERQQAENAKQQKEKIESIKGKTKQDKEKKKNLQEKAAIDAKNSAAKVKAKKENFLSEVQKHVDAVPKNPTEFDNPAARQALGMARALENALANKGRAWRAFHPFQKSKYTKAINNIMNGLEEKGYKKEVIDHMLHNPQKPENDPVVSDRKNQQNTIEDISASHEKRNQERLDFEQKAEKSNDGQQITVPEANNLNEIVNPKERSQFIVPEKKVDLQIGGPQQQTTVQQGPSTGK